MYTIMKNNVPLPHKRKTYYHADHINEGVQIPSEVLF